MIFTTAFILTVLASAKTWFVDGNFKLVKGRFTSCGLCMHLFVVEVKLCTAGALTFCVDVRQKTQRLSLCPTGYIGFDTSATIGEEDCV